MSLIPKQKQLPGNPTWLCWAFRMSNCICYAIKIVLDSTAEIGKVFMNTHNGLETATSSD